MKIRCAKRSRLRRRLDVAVGAHPGYPDRANFGRIASPLSPEEIEDAVEQQVASLAKMAESLGMKLVHVKPHGVLYHAANKNREVALALGRAAQTIDPQLILVGQAGSPALEAWRSMGLRCAAEAFADRAYEPDGSLRKRALPGALLDSPKSAAEQALNITVHHHVIATNGAALPVSAQTICIHSDTPGSAAIARAVSARLGAAGVVVRALTWVHS